MKLPEPIAWMERQMLNTGWSDWYHRNPRRKNDPLEITVDQIQFQFSPVYTEEQMRQAIRDAYEECAKVCESHIRYPSRLHFANSIRNLKEQVE
jgi:hypothetical protein